MKVEKKKATCKSKEELRHHVIFVKLMGLKLHDAVLSHSKIQNISKIIKIMLHTISDNIDVDCFAIKMEYVGLILVK